MTVSFASEWSADHVSAIADSVTAFATVLLLLVGWRQISAIRRQNRRWYTLAACERYYLDPLLDTALRRLFEAHRDKSFDADPSKFRLDVMTILNYLDGVAIGIYQGLYIERLAKDHLQAILNEHVRDYLEAGAPAKIGFSVDNFRYLTALHAHWTRISRPHFGEGWFRNRIS